jgi:hypothetical protein
MLDYRLAVLLAVPVVACAQEVDSLACEKEIQAELGVGSQVAVSTFFASSGKRVIVKVRLVNAPQAEVSVVKAKVDEIVRRSFRSHVDEVLVSL